MNIPPWPYYDEETVQDVANVLRSGKVNYWTGELTKKFEQAFAAYAGCEYGIAVANGTVALDLALRAVNIGEGDDVVVSPRSFIASVSSVVLCGAKPIFADVAINSQNITATSIEEVLTPNTKAIVLVHLAGWPCDMDPIIELAREKNIVIIEDCAQAHGARYKGKPVGGMGDIGVFSFCQDKIITTGGEGGMVVTNDTSLYHKMWSYKDHGKNLNKINSAAPSSFKWVHDSFGTNMRMTEMQSAIGLRQLSLLDKWVDKRQQLANVFNKRFAGVEGLRVSLPDPNIHHAYYKYYCFLDEKKFPKTAEVKDKILSQMKTLGVPCFFGSCPEIYREKAFENSGFQPEKRLPVAKFLGETSLMFPVHPTMEESHVHDVCDQLEKVFG